MDFSKPPITHIRKSSPSLGKVVHHWTFDFVFEKGKETELGEDGKCPYIDSWKEKWPGKEKERHLLVKSIRMLLSAFSAKRNNTWRRLAQNTRLGLKRKVIIYL